MIDYFPYTIIIRHYKGCWAGMRPLEAEAAAVVAAAAAPVIMAAEPHRPTLAICQSQLAVAIQAVQAALAPALHLVVACPTKVI